MDQQTQINRISNRKENQKQMEHIFTNSYLTSTSSKKANIFSATFLLCFFYF